MENDAYTFLLIDVTNDFSLRLIALHQLVRFNNVRPRIDLFDHQLELPSFYEGKSLFDKEFAKFRLICFVPASQTASSDTDTFANESRDVEVR